MFSLQRELLFYYEASFVSRALDIFVKTFFFELVFQYLASLRMVPVCRKKGIQHRTERIEQLQPSFRCKLYVQCPHADHV